MQFLRFPENQGGFKEGPFAHNNPSPFLKIFLKILFIYLTERERTQAGEAANRGRGRRRLPTEQGARCGA